MQINVTSIKETFFTKIIIQQVISHQPNTQGDLRNRVYLLSCERIKNRSYSPGAKTQGSPFIIWQIRSNLTGLYVQVFKYMNFAFYTYLNKTKKCNQVSTQLKNTHPFLESEQACHLMYTGNRRHSYQARTAILDFYSTSHKLYFRSQSDLNYKFLFQLLITFQKQLNI